MIKFDTLLFYYNIANITVCDIDPMNIFLLEFLKKERDFVNCRSARIIRTEETYPDLSQSLYSYQAVESK